MLAILPLVAFLSVFLVAGNLFPGWGWRRAFVRSFVATGCLMVLGNEGLSLVNGITKLGLAAVWTLPILAAAAWTVRSLRQGVPINLPPWRFNLTWMEWVLVVSVVVIAGVTAAVAWIGPPNTWDSLTYHMSRVAHWSQNASLRPYPTGIERQNFMSPVADIGMLQVYVLASGDRLVNFIEWLSMIVSIVAVGILAKDLGAGRLGQLFSAVFVASLPMGIAQASSTMTDYVVAVWVIAVASEGVLIAKGVTDRAPVIFAGLAVGLAIGSKPTSFPYLLPLAPMVGLALWRQRGVRDAVMWSIITAALVLVLNAGYFARNTAVYGSPIGRQRSVERHSNEILDWRVFVSNTLRNASLHAGTPNPYVNKGIALVLMKIHQLIGLDPADPRTSTHSTFRVRAPSMNEIKAGNLPQALLILAATFLALWKRRSLDRLALGIGVIAVTTFLALSLMFKFTIFGSRYHLPFFVLFAPVVGYIFARLVPPRGLVLIGVGLWVACVPWLVNLDPRPLLPTSGSNGLSILTRSRESLYFVLDPNAERPYREIASAIKGASCPSVGIMLSGGGAEYPLWVYLGAPRDDLRLEWIVGGTQSARFTDPAFEPCAVVCDSSCAEDLSSFRGLDRLYDRSGYRLFLGESQPGAD